MDNKEIKRNKRVLKWSEFFWTCLIITFFNILILYILPGNIYSDLSFILIVFFAFKLMGFTSRNIFLYGIFYFLLASVIVVSNNYALSHKLLDSISFYMLAFFILSFITYVYEDRFERKINFRKKTKVYSYLLLSFIILFLFSAIFFNRVDIKVHFFNKFFTEKYFQGIDVVQVDGKDIDYEINFSAEVSGNYYMMAPGDYYVVDNYFKVIGRAIDESDIGGSKIDYVGIYLDSGPQDGGRFIARCDHGIEIEDTDTEIGERFEGKGFTCQIDSNKIEDGIRKLYIYFHSNNFGWKYEELDLIVKNDNSSVFNEIFVQNEENAEFQYAGFSEDGEEIVIEEGMNILKYAMFPIDIKSGRDYLVSLEIKKLSDLDNNIYFDFLGDGYDDPEQEFTVESSHIHDRYIKVNHLIDSGSVPPGEDIYFRIFTSSSGSLKIEDLVIYEVVDQS